MFSGLLLFSLCTYWILLVYNTDIASVQGEYL